MLTEKEQNNPYASQLALLLEKYYHALAVDDRITANNLEKRIEIFKKIMERMEN